jgi:hypothetical protein
MTEPEFTPPEHPEQTGQPEQTVPTDENLVPAVNLHELALRRAKQAMRVAMCRIYRAWRTSYALRPITAWPWRPFRNRGWCW